MSYVGFQGYDYYRVREERKFWLQLLENRVAIRPMKVDETLKHIWVVINKDSKDAFYDYAKDFFKYVDCEIKQVQAPNEGYQFMKEHFGDCYGLVVVGKELFKQLIEAYNDSENHDRSGGTLATTGPKRGLWSLFSWFGWGSKRGEITITSNSMPVPILGYLPLKKDDPNRRWYTFLIDHFNDAAEARDIAGSALVVAEGFTELIHEHRDIQQLHPQLITFKEQLSRSTNIDNLKTMRVYAPSASLSDILRSST
jgi:hypothetical protein